MKKSLKGLIQVVEEDGKYKAIDQATKEMEQNSCLQTVFKDGKFVKRYTLTEIRERINEGLKGC